MAVVAVAVVVAEAVDADAKLATTYGSSTTPPKVMSSGEFFLGYAGEVWVPLEMLHLGESSLRRCNKKNRHPVVANKKTGCMPIEAMQPVSIRIAM